MAKLFGDVISRWSALTMPAVTVSSSPNGLPIATTGSPTSTLLESASDNGCSREDGASTLSTARSVEGSVPTMFALYVAPFQNLTETESAPATTCSFVTMWPSLSYTNPDPCPCCERGWNPFDWPETVISTTPLCVSP